jgi:hypothetical protein
LEETVEQPAGLGLGASGSADLQARGQTQLLANILPAGRPLFEALLQIGDRDTSTGGAAPGATLASVPTRRPRHSITETPPVREALDSLRRRGERVKLDDLVIRGARDRLREIEMGRKEDTEKALLRRELIEQLRTGDGLDAAAAYEARNDGWTH